MSLETASEHIVIPHEANWGRQRPRAGRKWQTEIAPGLTGAEDRQANAALPEQFIEFIVTPEDLEDRADLVSRLEAAKKAGKAAVPFYGRGSRLAANATSTSLVLAGGSHTWAIGDWLLIRDGALWAHRQVSNVSGTAGGGYTLTVTSLGATYGAGCQVWKLLLGKPVIEAYEMRTLDTGDVRIRVEEPRGTGERLEAACAAVVCVEGTGAFNVCPGPSLTIDAEEGCPVQRALTWPALEGAADYRIWIGDTATGPWTEITGDLTVLLNDGVYRALTRVAYYRGEASTTAYYSITALVGGNLMRGRVRTVAKNRIERLMRAVQERRHASLTDAIIAAESIDEFISWPGRTSPSVGVAADYPTDAWYDAELQTWDTANAQPTGTRFAQLLNTCRQAYLWGTGTAGALSTTYDWLVRYAVEDDFDNWQYVTDEATASDLYSNDPSPGAGYVSLAVPTATTTVALTEAHLEYCLETLCLLWVHYYESMEGAREQRFGAGSTEDDCPQAEIDAETTWDADSYASIGVAYVCQYSFVQTIDNDPDPPTTERSQVCIQGKEAFDLTNITRGTPKLFAYFTKNPSTGLYAAPRFASSAPGMGPGSSLQGYDSVWFPCVQAGESPLPNLVWETPIYGFATTYDNPLSCAALGERDETGWFVQNLLVGVRRSSLVEDAGVSPGFDYYA